MSESTQDKIELFVSGRPRTGTVWLNKLVADVLKSPLEAMPGPNVEPPMWFTDDHSGKYVVRKIHDGIRRGPTVYIQRDPRDVAVSIMHFYNRPDVMSSVIQMCSIDNEKMSYEYNARIWLDNPSMAEYYTKYEMLHKDGVRELQRMVFRLVGERVSVEECVETYRRQLFSTVKASNPERYGHAMRKGAVGDWRNYFTQEAGQYMQRHMGNFMMEHSYVKDRFWWKGLKA